MGFSDTFPFLHPRPRDRERGKAGTNGDGGVDPGPLTAGLSAWADSQPILDALPDPLVVLVPQRSSSGGIIDFVYAYANAPACAYHHRSQRQMLGARLRQLHPAVATNGLFEQYVRVVETGKALDLDALDYPNDGATGPIHHYDIRVVPVGGVICFLWRDVTGRVHAQKQLQDAERRYRLLARHASDVVIEVDADHRVLWVSESIEALLGWQQPAVMGRAAIEFVHRDDRGRAVRAGQDLDERGPFEGELRILCADDSWRWMGVTAHALSGEKGMAWVLSFRDIHDEVRIRTELHHTIQHDFITGLAVRGVALERLRRSLDGLKGSGETLAVLSIGIDGLTQVNDALTHTGGDKLIAFLAARITKEIGNPDQVGRGTGDEFIVLLSPLPSGADAALTAERILRACQAPIVIGGQPIDPTVSIGIATARAGTLPDELLRDASLAMRQAKVRGRNCYAFVDDALATEAHTRLMFAAELQRGLAAGEFAAWFMPIVAFDTGEVTGYEALVRWLRPDGIEMEPAAFLPFAERSRLIARIDLVVLHQALAALSRLPESLTMAVNVSAATFSLDDYPELVCEALRVSGVAPHRLHLEVTETALLTVTDRIRQQIQQLASHGVRWYVDDFGTGYSSISHLRDLPIAGLKLDQSFTAAMRAKDHKSLRLAQALVGVAEGLELDTVAEGVATIEEACLLASQGWLHGQGWLYGKATPLPVDPFAGSV
ncbi:bifunctional diguanylate cyclase/phosphodiesterase [Synechococcus sp. CCY 9618]|uniref:putative bifunctional diguanylate cyclase/phosphodiesterase n=1 Tax=Synechococcus sp. CCY 9618 TaxID=2815602 RepID=UPI001C236A30|nr:EAL domain-containing protein [Synechococcus sp. CCY 9618]